MSKFTAVRKFAEVEPIKAKRAKVHMLYEAPLYDRIPFGSIEPGESFFLPNSQIEELKKTYGTRVDLISLNRQWSYRYTEGAATFRCKSVDKDDVIIEGSNKWPRRRLSKEAGGCGMPQPRSIGIRVWRLI